MKTLIAILIVISFLQSTIIPLDLVLIILICRGFLKEEKENFYLAFSFGLLVAFLGGHFLGIQSVVYLGIIFFTHLISKTQFSRKNLNLVIFLSFVNLVLNTVIISLFINVSIQLFPKVILETIFCVPIFYLLRIWEERFVPKKDIKLRV